MWKIALYTNIQNSHIIPIENPKAFPVRTGYDSVVPYRMDKKFVDFAKKDGTVIKVTKTSVVIKYKDASEKHVMYVLLFLWKIAHTQLVIK